MYRRAALAGMRIEAGHEDAWSGYAESVLQVVVQAAYHRFQTLRCDGRGYPAKWQVGGGQCHPQAGRGEHHYHLCGVALFRQVFRVTGKRDAGVVDDGLVHRGRDQRLKLTIQTAVYRPVECLQHVAGVGGVGLAADDFRGKLDGVNTDVSGLRCCFRLVGRQMDAAAQLTGAGFQQCRVADQHQFGLDTAAIQCQTQIRTDAGRLAGRDREAGYHCLHINAACRAYSSSR